MLLFQNEFLEALIIVLMKANILQMLVQQLLIIFMV